ncbi:hypothetical protein KDA_57140 [Dictyobacter alpinus]|uniref:Uncharacterized protein n=1 Tax=Dictyobacter alpinus TaxID=2014873 RepID=A0A402BG29_9CHLR|nr:hypothetical protein [Dictyobacter alpinus]GCE30230.1 hypothetical protein KDA_57140 [Dictyobacter alpinus]
MEAVIVYCLVLIFFVALGIFTAAVLLNNPYRLPKPSISDDPAQTVPAKSSSKSVYVLLALFLTSMLVAFVSDRRRAHVS